MIDKSTEYWIKAMNWGCRIWGCHQIPERSFFIHHYQFPVCARCTGIMLGELIRLCTLKKTLISPKISALMMIPLIIDGTIQHKTDYESNNAKRLASGLLFGYGATELLFSGIKFIVKKSRRH